MGKLFEKIMKENFPNLVKKVDIQVQEAQKVPSKMGQHPDYWDARRRRGRTRN